MTSTENRIPLGTSLSSFVVLAQTFFGERSRLPKVRARLSKEINDSLPAININPSDSRYLAISERFCDFLPRSFASVAVYCLLSNKRYKDVSREGLDASRLFWQIGHKQDDIIDAPNRENDGNNILHTVFSGEGIGHRKTLALLYKKIHSSLELGVYDKHYLLIRVKSWFDFLKKQEEGIVNIHDNQFDFDFCKKYREDQNMMAGRVVCALLNWSDCKTETGQRVELIIPRFSYMSQIIDDIGDLPEDIEANRPSFAIGVLNEYEKEKSGITNYIKNKNIKKFTYKELQRLAPQSTEILDKLFEDYRQTAFELGGPKTEIILRIAKLAYCNYTNMRNIVHKINPAWATF